MYMPPESYVISFLVFVTVKIITYAYVSICLLN